jgi:HAD superfamily hydrolase (TIGR01509 family)
VFRLRVAYNACMIRAIIFDFFDVIHTDPYNAWLKSHGLTREGDYLKVVQRMDRGGIDIQHFFAELGALCGESAEKVAREFMLVSRVDDNVLAILSVLRKQYSIGLLSNSPSKLIRDILRANDLERYFDEIVISSEVGHIKPSKEIFNIMLRRLGVQSSEAIFIDDSKHHIDGAEAVGIKGIQFTDATRLTVALAAASVLDPVLA